MASKADPPIRPYVVVDSHRNTAIFLLRGRKFVHLIGRDPHFRVQRVEFREFDTEWRPLFYYSNGAPGEVPYDVQTAARRYLDYCRNAGTTETALRYLTDIARGKYDMSTVESAPSSEEKKDVVIPKMEKLETALANATKSTSTSTKNGTTAAAKRPSKARSVHPPASNGSSTSTTKEQDMNAATRTATASKSKTPAAVVMKGAPKSAAKKAPAAKKPAAKKSPPTAKKPAAKKSAAKKSAAKKSNGHGRAPKFSDDSIITFVAENPKRAGTDAYRKFAQYKKGMRIGDVVKKNVNRADVNYNIARGFVKVK